MTEQLGLENNASDGGSARGLEELEPRYPSPDRLAWVALPASCKAFSLA